MFLMDAVAKSSVLYVKGHAGYSSCTKCKQEGEFINNRICFPNLSFIKRTDASFINHADDQYHNDEHSILEKIPNFGFVSCIPLDYMHLVLLGVVKKFLVLTWCFGHPPHKLCAADVNQISYNLLKLIPFIPNEFSRKPRHLKESKHCKATEFRQFLLYTSPIVLKNILETKKFHHFLTLHVAITMLISPVFCKTHLNYVEKLLQYFVKKTKVYMGNIF